MVQRHAIARAMDGVAIFGIMDVVLHWAEGVPSSSRSNSYLVIYLYIMGVSCDGSPCICAFVLHGNGCRGKFALAAWCSGGRRSAWSGRQLALIQLISVLPHPSCTGWGTSLGSTIEETSKVLSKALVASLPTIIYSDDSRIGKQITGSRCRVMERIVG